MGGARGGTEGLRPQSLSVCQLFGDQAFEPRDHEKERDAVSVHIADAESDGDFAIFPGDWNERIFVSEDIADRIPD